LAIEAANGTRDTYALMEKRMKSVLAVAFLLLISASSFLVGQSPAPARGSVIGAGLFTSFVENMDRSLAFYHDAFGMDVPALPASGQRPYNQPNPQLFAMFQINGAKERHQSARIPDTRISIEFMEIQNVDHKSVELRMQDPGVVTLKLIVRDIDAALAKAKAGGGGAGNDIGRRAGETRRWQPSGSDSRC
jgi:predicted enzyme related to lactoylglutathione lyase